MTEPTSDQQVSKSTITVANNSLIASNSIQHRDPISTYFIPTVLTMASHQQDLVNRPQHTVLCDSRLFQMKDHCNESFSVMNQLRKDKQLCDITFRVGTQSFLAHRVILASASPYLRAMFTCGMKESSQQEIELRGIEAKAMDFLIDYAYTGEVMITIDNVQDLLPAAGILQLKELKEACCSFLGDHMDVTNCLGIKQFADLHSCPKLLRQANRFIVLKFVEIIQHDEFLQLPRPVLKEILENDHLHVDTEVQVFRAFLAWVNHDLEKRALNSFELMDLIRLALIPKNYWTDMFQQEPLFKQSQACHAYIKGYLIGLKYDTLPRKPRTPVKTIYTIGGRNSQRCLCSCERYIAEENRWEELPPMKQVRTAVAAGTIDGKLYAVGGECETKCAHEGTLYLASVEYFDPIHNTWISAPGMKQPRSFTAVATLNNKIYAVGGETTSLCYKSVECFDARQKTWTTIPDMAIARSGAGACGMSGKLYVIGGQDRATHHSTVECYDPSDNTWRLVANMHHARSGVATVVYENHIYAIGGRDRHRQAYYDVVERYDPKTNTWEPFQSLSHARAWPSACVFNGELYVSGGYDGQYRLKTVERFDRVEKKWKNIADMCEYRAGCGTAVL